MPNLTLIGFDFGTRWIGTAVGQTITKTANPAKTFESKNNKPDWLGIEKLVKEYQPNILVIGLPLNAKGEEQVISKKARKFARQLEGRFHIKTEMVDERLTTREVYIDTSDNHKSKQQIDALSAMLITQSWIDNNDTT
ncbi:MAG: Holliday junction resolvase RuvX [Gammaproteobacteria bacterium]|nr:Holliday junction resolvase RuvX [Gammaproteobacteria bacterium]